MGAVRKYHVTHNGHRTIMRLNDQDVKAYPDAQPVDEPAAVDQATPKAAASKTRSAADKTRLAGGDKSSN